MKDETHTSKEEEIKGKIISIIAKLDNGSHSSNQLQGVDEALYEFYIQIRQEAIAQEREKFKEIVEKVLEKYKDRGDERYGWVKHTNTILQNIRDDLSEVNNQ